MSYGGYGAGGTSLGSPSQVFYNTPKRGYQDLDGWYEELCNAIGGNLEIWYARFASAQARANLLDPTYTPVEVTTDFLATATAPANVAPNKDSMLDVLAYIALAQYPLPHGLTTAQKQALVAVGWDALARKGNRIRLLKLVSKMTNGVAYGWTLPPSQFSIIVPDGAPDAGYGDWVPQPSVGVGTVATTSGSPTVTGTGTAFSTTWTGYKIRIGSNTYWIQNVGSATSITLSANAAATVSGVAFSIIPAATARPWIMEAVRTVDAPMFPGFVLQGVGYSQFRAGYSAAGEPVLPSGARLNILNDEHFSSWAAGSLVSWLSSGAATYSESQTNAYINHEFTNSCVDIDLTGAGAATSRTIYQQAKIDNQRAYRVELDYAYYNAQGVNTLRAYVKDMTNGAYYQPSTRTWGSTQYFALPVSDSTPTRKRYDFDLTPNAASSTAATLGTAQLEIGYYALSDGTATTQTHYYLYRGAVYPKFDDANEALFDGDPIGDWPLRDALGQVTMTRTTATLIEPANATRSAVKTATGSGVTTFDYHPALTGRGLRCSAIWNNIVKGSNDFGADWVATSTTRTSGQSSPDLTGSTTATKLAASGTSNKIACATGITPTSNSYIAGVWFKNSTSGGVYTDVTLRLVSTTTKSVTFTVAQDNAWHLLAMPAQAFSGGDVANLSFEIAPGAAISNGIGYVYGSYVYDVTGKTDVLYPPVRITAVGSSGTVTATKPQAIAAGANCLHPFLQRTMVSVSQGALEMTVVPTYGAASQPNCVLFDSGESTGKNRIAIDIASGVLRLLRYNNSSTLSPASPPSLTLVGKADPSAGQCSWFRDRAVIIRARWFSDGSCAIGCGTSSASASATGSTYSDAATVAPFFGCDLSSANQFDGIIRDVRSSLVGAPTT